MLDTLSIFFNRTSGKLYFRFKGHIEEFVFFLHTLSLDAPFTGNTSVVGCFKGIFTEKLETLSRINISNDNFKYHICQRIKVSLIKENIYCFSRIVNSFILCNIPNSILCRRILSL